MAAQRDLFLKEIEPLTPPAQQHSPTSKEAATSIEPLTGRLQLKVLTAIRESGEVGLTDEEIQTKLSMNPSTQRPRRIECLDQGFIKDSGRTRKTRSGRQAVVWVAVVKQQ